MLVEVLVLSTYLAVVPVLGTSTATTYFFGDGGAAGLGAFAGATGAGDAAGLASSSSTSKIRVELAARSGLTDLSP